MSPSVQNFGGTGKQVQCSVLSCSQLIFTANTTLSEGTGSAPAPSPAAPITGQRRTATSPCARTEKGATQHSQNYKIFTWSHEFWHRAGDWALAQRVMCHFKVKENAVRNTKKLWCASLMQSAQFLLTEENLSFCGSSSTGENTWSGLAASNTFSSNKKTFLEVYP